MSGSEAGVIGGLWAMLAWGVSDWFSSKSSKKFNVFDVNLAVQIPGLAVWPLVMLTTHQPVPSLRHILVLIIAGVVFAGAFLAFIKALAKGSVGIIVPLSSTYPLITIILNLIFLTNIFSNGQYFAMLLIVVGVCLLAYEKNRQKIPFRDLHRETVFALTAGLFWGVGNFLQNFAVGRESWISIVAFINIAMGLSSILAAVIVNRRRLNRTINSLSKNREGWVAGITLSAGSVGFYGGGNRAGSIIIPSVVASAAPLVSSLLSWKFDNDRLTIVKRAGAVIAVGGIILLNLV